MTSAFATPTGAQTLPSGWASSDIGATTVAGWTQYAGGTFTLAGAGDIAGAADSFRFAYRQVSGDVTIVARVVSVQKTHPWSKAGVMVRESLASNSAFGMMLISGSSGSAFQKRLTTGALRTSTPGTGVGAPYWVRLERRGSEVTASQSSDGATWTTIGTMTLNAPTMYVGLAVTSAMSRKLATGVFDNVLMSTPTTNQLPAVTLTGPADGATFTAPASFSLAATASDADGTIAQVAFYAGSTLLATDTSAPYSYTWNGVAAGSYSLTAVAQDNAGATTTSAARTVTVSTGSSNQPPVVSVTAPAAGAVYTEPALITITATASDTDGTIAEVAFYSGSTLLTTDTSSPYSYAWSGVTAGSYSLTAVARDNAGAATTSAARTVTVSAALPNSPPVVSLTAPANGAVYTAPASIAITATASDTDGTIAQVAFYAGSTLLATDTASPYSYAWSGVTAGSYSLTAVAQDNAGATTTSAARIVTVAGLPSGWTATDIGAPSLAGSTQYANGTFTVEGAGVDVWDASDQFRYVYQPFTGDIEITSRVVTLENTNEWAKAGVMFRETLAANAVQTSLVVTPANGTNFYRRLTTGALTQPGPVGSMGAPLWVRLERRGSTVTGFRSSDGVTWTAVGTATMATATLYLGLEVTSHDPTQAATASFDNVTVRVPSVNQAPAVSLTAPANGATFTAPASIALAATASDTDGTIAGVDFYAGTTLLATDTSSPYTFTWSAVPAGSYALSARARDNSGASTTSAARTVTVSAGSTNLAPTVSLTTPAAGAVFTAPATVAIAATASDSDGSVVQVDFYAGAVLIGSDTTSPYSMSWSSVAAGTYALTAVARDNAGAMTVSGARDIRVDSATLPRTAIFTPSTNHATAVDRYFLEIFPEGANPAVANPVATRDLGKPAVVNGEIQVDISSTTTALPAGSYIATVTAIGDGGSARSAASPAFTR